MPNCKGKPRYRIVSVRVSEEERETLEKISRESNRNISDLMREALQVMVPREISA
jgi:predicted transcriptional regulator